MYTLYSETSLIQKVARPDKIAGIQGLLVNAPVIYSRIKCRTSYGSDLALFVAMSIDLCLFSLLSYPNVTILV